MQRTYPTDVFPLLRPDRDRRFVCPSQVDIGDVVRLDDDPLPVVVTSGALVDGHRVFSWVSVARKSDGLPVLEGSGIHDVGERIKLLARGETVTASEICDSDLLLFDGRASVYGIVVGDPRLIRADVLDIAWRAGRLPLGMPRVVGNLQRDPAETLRRAPRGWSE